MMKVRVKNIPIDTVFKDSVDTIMFIEPTISTIETIVEVTKIRNEVYKDKHWHYHESWLEFPPPRIKIGFNLRDC